MANPRFVEPTPNFSSAKASKDHGARAVVPVNADSRKSKRRRNGHHTSGTTG